MLDNLLEDVNIQSFDQLEEVAGSQRVLDNVERYALYVANVLQVGGEPLTTANSTGDNIGKCECVCMCVHVCMCVYIQGRRSRSGRCGGCRTKVRQAGVWRKAQDAIMEHTHLTSAPWLSSVPLPSSLKAFRFPKWQFGSKGKEMVFALSGVMCASCALLVSTTTLPNQLKFASYGPDIHVCHLHVFHLGTG